MWGWKAFFPCKVEHIIHASVYNNSCVSLMSHLPSQILLPPCQGTWCFVALGNRARVSATVMWLRLSMNWMARATAAEVCLCGWFKKTKNKPKNNLWDSDFLQTWWELVKSTLDACVWGSESPWQPVNTEKSV